MPRDRIKIFEDSRFAPGFRFSGFDAVVLVVGSLFVYAYSSSFTAIGLRIESPIPAHAVGIATVLPLTAFFLFCNVFRVCRSLELAWAVVYVVLMGTTIRLGLPNWQMSIAIATLAMIAVIATELRKPSYHGVGWRWINPNLPTWWKVNTGAA